MGLGSFTAQRGAAGRGRARRGAAGRGGARRGAAGARRGAAGRGGARRARLGGPLQNTARSARSRYLERTLETKERTLERNRSAPSRASPRDPAGCCT